MKAIDNRDPDKTPSIPHFVEKFMRKVVSGFLSPLEAEVTELSHRIEKLTLEVHDLEEKKN